MGVVAISSRLVRERFPDKETLEEEPPRDGKPG